MRSKHPTQKQIMLYALNEADPGWEKPMERHLKQCSQCRNLLKQNTKMAELCSLYKKELPAGSLIRVRNRLSASLVSTVQTGDKPGRVTGAWFLPYPALQAAAAVVLLALGVLIGRFGLPPSTPLTSLDPSSPPGLAALLEIVPAADNNEVRIQYQTLVNHRLAGDDTRKDIVRLLCYALLHDSRDQVRLTALERLEKSVNREMVQEALVGAVRKDINPGVRLKAIRLLRTRKTDESLKSLYLYALFQDGNSGVRMEALHALLELNDPDIRPILEKKAAENEYIHSLLMREKNIPFSTSDI